MKKGFFSKLMGGDDAQYDEYYGEDTQHRVALEEGEDGARRIHLSTGQHAALQHEESEPELAVDVYQTENDIVIKALVAGVMGQNLDISLTREMISISGTRQEEKEVNEDGYFQRELYWGSFSRNIMLPEEVDVDMAEATESHGILTIRLPKINKKRQTKLKVRSK